MPYVDCETSNVPNTTMAVFTNGLGNQTMYRFTPNDGYVLHVKRGDAPIYDEDDNLVGYTERYCDGSKTVPIDYDFSVVVPDTHTYTDENGMIVNIPIERVGKEELYTLPASIVPST